ncbi:MAG: ParB/Srx family N-terminal domain-containing protein [Candidatus Omnitrophota bacterium]|jgi:hypothetical protein
MQTLEKMFKSITVDIDQLLLDPNNPRFAELGESPEEIPEARFGEKNIQNEAMRKMKFEKFDVSELRDTIKMLGFLPIDKVVVKPWKNKDSGKYVVIEGNRRITALKWLIELHDVGKETLTQGFLDSIKRFEVLNVEDESNPELIKWIIPGLRHVSGIKEWGPYQKAKTVFYLREAGKSAQEAAQSLGLSVANANRLWRAFLALEQMYKDEDIGADHVDSKLYSYFEEVFRKPNIREWLDWKEDERAFKNTKNLKNFYSWILGEPDDEGTLGDPKLPEAKSVRELDLIIGDSSAMTVFCQKNGSLAKALARYEIDHPEEWKPCVKQAKDILTSISADSLKKMEISDLKLLNDLKETIQVLIDDRTKLVG